MLLNSDTVGPARLATLGRPGEASHSCITSHFGSTLWTNPSPASPNLFGQPGQPPTLVLTCRPCTNQLSGDQLYIWAFMISRPTHATSRQLSCSIKFLSTLQKNGQLSCSVCHQAMVLGRGRSSPQPHIQALAQLLGSKPSKKWKIELPANPIPGFP